MSEQDQKYLSSQNDSDLSCAVDWGLVRVTGPNDVFAVAVVSHVQRRVAEFGPTLEWIGGVKVHEPDRRLRIELAFGLSSKRYYR